jgi:hypothetical protein
VQADWISTGRMDWEAPTLEKTAPFANGCTTAAIGEVGPIVRHGRTQELETIASVTAEHPKPARATALCYQYKSSNHPKLTILPAMSQHDCHFASTAKHATHALHMIVRQYS